MSITVPGCAALWEHFSHCSCNRTVLGELVRARCCVCHSGHIPPALSSCYLQELQSLLSIKFCMWGCDQEPHSPWWSLSILWQENTPKPWVGTVVPKGLSHTGNALDRGRMDTLHCSSKKTSSSASFLAQISSQAGGLVPLPAWPRAPSTAWVCPELPPAG